jgi:glycerophosphoryl diester phosphodiesterase
VPPPVPYLVAHRLPASRGDTEAVVAAGATVVELDVRLLGGELVVTHFLPLWRLRHVQHDHGRFRRGPDPAAPTLAAALEWLPPALDVLLDLKDDRGEPALRLAAAVVAAVGDPSRFHASTKNPHVLAVLRAGGLRTWRSVATRRLLGEVLRADSPDWGLTVRHQLLDAATVARLGQRTRHVGAWTVNDVARAQALCGWGVDGITSDSLDVMAALSRRR